MAEKISIIGQISEIERDIAQRQRDYPRLMREGKMRQAEADLLMERANAIRKTLYFCKNNLADIESFVASRKKAGSQ